MEITDLETLDIGLDYFPYFNLSQCIPLHIQKLGNN